MHIAWEQNRLPIFNETSRRIQQHTIMDIVKTWTHRTNNLINGSNHIIQKVSSIQTPRRNHHLWILLHNMMIMIIIHHHPSHNAQAAILLHHLMIQKPQAFGHVTDISPLTPNTKEEDQVYDTRCHRGRSSHTRLRWCRHSWKVWHNTLIPTPFHIVAKHLGMQCMYRRGWLQCWR